LSIGIKDHFRIRIRLETLAKQDQLTANLLEIVDLSIENNPVIPDRILHRLATTRAEINDTRATMIQSESLSNPYPLVVWAAVNHALSHPGQDLQIAQADITANPTHFQET
jgi:hypothetical protein